MTAPMTRPTARTIYGRVLWAAAAVSWAASVAVAMVLLATGVQLDWPVILLWTILVVQLAIGAMTVASMPAADAIAARAYAAGLADAEDELSQRRN